MGRWGMAVLAMLVVAGPAAGGTLEDAQAAFKRRDYAGAARLFMAVAEEGNVMAQVALGTMYADGVGVSRDEQTALRWLRPAAEKGWVGAQYSLAKVLYRGGLDYPEAARWYRAAADQGDTMAQFALGLMYRLGQGVRRDDVQSHLWFDLVASRTVPGQTLNTEANRNRERVESRMTAENLVAARELARAWRPRD